MEVIFPAFGFRWEFDIIQGDRLATHFGPIPDSESYSRTYCVLCNILIMQLKMT